MKFVIFPPPKKSFILEMFRSYVMLFGQRVKFGDVAVQRGGIEDNVNRLLGGKSLWRGDLEGVLLILSLAYQVYCACRSALVHPLLQTISGNTATANHVWPNPLPTSRQGSKDRHPQCSANG